MRTYKLKKARLLAIVSCLIVNHHSVPGCSGAFAEQSHVRLAVRCEGCLRSAPGVADILADEAGAR